MSRKRELEDLSCTDCSIYNCRSKSHQFPGFCLTTKDNDGHSIAADIEEILEFAKRIGAKKIGIATCAGLIEESKTFADILTARGLEYYSAICKVGSVDKTEIGVLEEHKIKPGSHEAMCNPILQARILNYHNTDLNVVVGLCVGHDSLFTKYSKALVTTLVTKDRITGHNPVAALYTAHSYYKKLLQEKE